MNLRRRLLLQAVPTGITLFCWVTMRTVASFTDESMTSYGFPFPWHALQSISSMSRVVAVLPLLVDLNIYVLASFVTLSVLQRRFDLGRYMWIWIFLWVIAGASLVVNLSVLFFDPQFILWSLDDYYGGDARRSYGIEFGIGR